MFLSFMLIDTNFSGISVIVNHVSLSWLTLWVFFRSPIIYHQKRKGKIVLIELHVKFPGQFINKFNLQCSFSQIGLKHRSVLQLEQTSFVLLPLDIDIRESALAPPRKKTTATTRTKDKKQIRKTKQNWYKQLMYTHTQTHLHINIHTRIIYKWPLFFIKTNPLWIQSLFKFY